MLRFSVLFSLLLSLVACGSDGEKRRAEYLDADYLKRLELPPDLIFEDSSTRLILPVPTERAMQQHQKDLEEDMKANNK